MLYAVDLRLELVLTGIRELLVKRFRTAVCTLPLSLGGFFTGSGKERAAGVSGSAFSFIDGCRGISTKKSGEKLAVVEWSVFFSAAGFGQCLHLAQVNISLIVIISNVEQTTVCNVEQRCKEENAASRKHKHNNNGDKRKRFKAIRSARCTLLEISMWSVSIN